MTAGPHTDTTPDPPDLAGPGASPHTPPHTPATAAPATPPTAPPDTPPGGLVTAAPGTPPTAPPDTPPGGLVTEVPREKLASAAHQRVVPLRHPWRWVAVAVVVVLLAQFAHGLIANPFFAWDRFRYWFLRPVILDGVVITIKVTAYAAVLGFLGGVLLALGRLSKNPLLRTASWAYTWLFRSIPLIVLLLVLFNFTALYPSLGLGVPFGPQLVEGSTANLLGVTTMAVVGLSLNEAAYASEVVRGGILSVDQGQLEAAETLGLSRFRTVRRVILPQALRSIVPNYVNQLINLIKSSSLVYYVSLLDVFGAVQSMGSTYPGDIIPLLMVATVWYLILTSILSVVQFYVERFYARGAVRTLPLTPFQQFRASLSRNR